MYFLCKLRDGGWDSLKGNLGKNGSLRSTVKKVLTVAGNQAFRCFYILFLRIYCVYQMKCTPRMDVVDKTSLLRESALQYVH